MLERTISGRVKAHELARLLPWAWKAEQLTAAVDARTPRRKRRRRRGYSVTARRNNADTLIHVQTGPFVNRNDANSVRQKLLNDGYNAIVE